MKNLLFFLIVTIPLLATTPSVYKELSNPLHPTWRDYKQVQAYIERKDRPELQGLNRAIKPGGVLHDYACRARRFRIIGKWPWQRPKLGVVPYHCSLEDKRIAICTYASYNHKYPKGIEILQQTLKSVGFKGHFVYRIGGWPDAEGGSLRLAHVPYAFKPCFFRELQRLGFERVLWLDTSIRPVNDLQRAFDAMAERGYFVQGDGQLLGQYCNGEVAQALGSTPEEVANLPSITAGMIGVDFRHPIGRTLIERWYAAAEQEIPFLSPRPEQNALSILLHQMNLTDWESSPTLVWNKEQCNASTLFFMDHVSIR